MLDNFRLNKISRNKFSILLFVFFFNSISVLASEHSTCQNIFTITQPENSELGKMFTSTVSEGELDEYWRISNLETKWLETNQGKNESPDTQFLLQLLTEYQKFLKTFKSVDSTILRQKRFSVHGFPVLLIEPGETKGLGALARGIDRRFGSALYIDPYTMLVKNAAAMVLHTDRSIRARFQDIFMTSNLLHELTHLYGDISSRANMSGINTLSLSFDSAQSEFHSAYSYYFGFDEFKAQLRDLLFAGLFGFGTSKEVDAKIEKIQNRMGTHPLLYPFVDSAEFRANIITKNISQLNAFATTAIRDLPGIINKVKKTEFLPDSQLLEAAGLIIKRIKYKSYDRIDLHFKHHGLTAGLSDKLNIDLYTSCTEHKIQSDCSALKDFIIFQLSMELKVSTELQKSLAQIDKYYSSGNHISYLNEIRSILSKIKIIEISYQDKYKAN